MTDPLIKRGTIRSTTGIEVDSLNVTLMSNSDVTVQGLPLPQFARLGGFDGARVSVDRHFSASWASASCGSLNLFTGRVGPVDISGVGVKLTVNSDLELLNVKMPRNIYMAQCVHTVYGAGCGLVAATFLVTGNTTSGSTALSINCNLAQAAGYFDLGTIEFTTGANAGEKRSVKTHTSGVLVPSFPFPYTPIAGDLFQAKPGCDKLYATCNSAKFSNGANFRGFEFIPSPELTY